MKEDSEMEEFMHGKAALQDKYYQSLRDNFKKVHKLKKLTLNEEKVMLLRKKYFPEDLRTLAVFRWP